MAHRRGEESRENGRGGNGLAHRRGEESIENGRGLLRLAIGHMLVDPDHCKMITCI